jgi:predicted enzyme related to lactoylglutathione lyase
MKRAEIAATLLLALAWTTPARAASYAVGPQYDTTHVYVSPSDFDRFTASYMATFGGGSTSPQGVTQATPTPSQTISQLVFSQAGNVSVFGFKTPIPYPFGTERTGYLANDFDGAVRAARAAGASVLVAPFPDPIGRDAVITWPGGVNMQLYWHKVPPTYKPLAMVPENRIYVSPDAVNNFIRDWVTFSGGRVVSDNPKASGAEIGRPGDTYRRVRIESLFGKMTVFVTDGHLPYPFGIEKTGYEVANLDETLTRAKSAGVAILVQPFVTDGRRETIAQFPGGYVAEIHANIK